MYPTLSTGGRCIALSTPNGCGNWFHQTYIDAEENRNDFFDTRLAWDVHPDRDAEWFEKETKNMSKTQVAQELNCNFNMSGETVFHPEDMGKIKEAIREPKHRTGFDRNFWIWEEYQEGFTYMITADVARGDGKDYSAFHIFKIETMEVIGEYQGKLTPDMFSRMLIDVGHQYGKCMVVVENNTIGWTVLDKLQENNYPNLYHSYKSSHEYVDALTAETQSNTVMGFSMTTKTRPLVIAKLEEFVRNKLVTVYSKRLFNEMETFIWHNGKPQAMKKYNDDLIMAFAIGCWVKDAVYTTNKRDEEYRKAFLSSMTKSNSKLNTTIPGMVGYRSVKTRHQIDQAREFIWLLKG